jgi:clan AA aspartic protease
MITGIVNDELEATIRLTVRGPSGRICRVDAVIDSGFDGLLSLPPALIAELGLIWQETGSAILADGTMASFDIFEGTIVWDRRNRDIAVDEADTMPLVGTALLSNHRLKADFRPGGKVAIKALRRTPD